MSRRSFWKSRRSFFVFIFLGLFLLFLIAFPFIIMRLMIPFQQLFVQTGSSLASCRQTPQQDETDLSNETLAQLYIELAQLQDENKNLREQLNFLENRSYNHVSASILAHSLGTFQATFLIDRGSDDGIQVGDPVMVSKGVLIGKVQKVWKQQAKIQALTDRESKTAATILSSRETLGVIEGDLGGFLRFKFIPKQIDLEIGDIIITSGLETAIVPDLLIGKVHAIKEEENKAFKEAIIEPFVDYRLYASINVLTRSFLYE